MATFGRACLILGLAVAQGAISRMRLRVRKSTRLDQIDSMNTHRSSEPSCEAHGAAIL